MIQKITLDVAKIYDKNLPQITFGDNFLTKLWKNLCFNYYDIPIFI